LFNDSRDENHFSKIKNEIHAYEATAESVPEEKEKSWRIEIEITSVKTTRWQPATGKLLLYVSKNNFKGGTFILEIRFLCGNPQELDRLLILVNLILNDFSLKIYRIQQFVQSREVRIISPTRRRGLTYYSHQARAWAMNIH